MTKLSGSAKLAAETTSDPRWSAIASRDISADGSFYYSVKTTGVYCRPSCGARIARPENVQFHPTPAAAEKAGFRACMRCQPNGLSATEKNAARIARVCRLIERSEQAPTLEKLAKHAGMSVFHLHRLFKTLTGLTPAEYAAAHRSQRVRKALMQAESVTEAIYEAGFNSSGRFYESSQAMLGMAPKTFRDGGSRTAIHFAVGECSLGSILVAKSERGVCAVLLGDEPSFLLRDLQDRFPRAELIGDERAFEDDVAKVIGLVEQPGSSFDLPLDIRGTAFQQRVWKALQDIPAGSTASYTQIAETLGMPKAVRAVAQACGANAIAVAIPCHRVIRNDGSLAGYRWGIDRKRTLLDREAHTTDSAPSR